MSPPVEPDDTHLGDEFQEKDIARILIAAGRAYHVKVI